MLLVDELRQMVEEECKKETNIFRTANIHIAEVVRFGKLLSQKLSADEEIVEISCLLHDWGSIIGRYHNHHLIGASEAEIILSNFNYPQDRIERVKHCIHAHRASKQIERETLEAEIVASADVMTYFTTMGSFFYLAYGVHKLDYEIGLSFLRKKIEKGWEKVMPEAREMVREEYEWAMKILEK